MALHKKTDPGAEFEARRRITHLGVDPEAKPERVPDLGDRAYLLTEEGGTAQLRVLEGGAVVSLSLLVFTQHRGDGPEDVVGDEPEIPDLSPYRSAVISDMRDLMSSLKK